jgi:transcriptional regulator with XRE-family HTH domain
MFLVELAARLRAARAASGHTQEQAAEHAQCSVSTIANYERGETEIGALRLTSLCALYQVSPAWLLMGSATPPHRFAPGPARCRHEIPITDRCDACNAAAMGKTG